MASLTETTPTRTFRYSAAMDNHQPVARDFSYGPGEYYAPGTAWEEQTESIVLLDALNRFSPKTHPHINFVVDDGVTARVFYVAAWHEERNRLILHPFPTNPTGATRPDNGREIDYSNWALGPRKTFHLKVTWDEALKPTYAQYQADRVLKSGADTFAVKVETRGAGEDSTDTKWLNITDAQLSAIREILGWND